MLGERCNNQGMDRLAVVEQAGRMVLAGYSGLWMHRGGMGTPHPTDVFGLD